MKRFSRKLIPLKFKLFCYFLLFGGIILIILWLFQSFFLEGFYTMTKSAQVEKNSDIISRSIQENKNIRSTIENISRDNQLSVYVYDTTDSLYDLIYISEYDNPSTRLSLKYHDIYRYYTKAEQNGGNYMGVISSPVSQFVQLSYNKYFGAEASADKPQAKLHFIDKDNPDKIQNMIYCDIIRFGNDSECFLLVTSSISPLGNSIEIMKDQMLIVSIVFIMLSVFFSIYASYKIARPISKTNGSAKELAKKNYDVEFSAKGYLEVEELNNTLNYAKTELAATEKLQRELIANISHDLRTPLTMITGYAEVMRDLPGENTPENVQIIIDEATRLSTLVNDLLDLSKLQSGAVQAENKRFCLTDSFSAIFQRYSKLTEQYGYTISFLCSEKVWVNADELRISQVIYNLINNAINHCGEDKTVIVEQKVKGKKVTVSVTDHGEGIPADKLKDIWERYYKVDREHKRGVIGSGLGLSIVKGILDSHKAHYGVRSTLGKGSTFWFELSADTVKKNRSNTSEESSPDDQSVCAEPTDQ